GRHLGGGSGGSIWLDVGNLSGTGIIEANGGWTQESVSSVGGGGGGRVAIYYDTNIDFNLSTITATGGTGGFQAGEPGTVYTEDVTP
ncbi:MAG: hypothetical protein AAF419_01560, partial [Pseudomonadota bacterium]